MTLTAYFNRIVDTPFSHFAIPHMPFAAPCPQQTGGAWSGRTTIDVHANFEKPWLGTRAACGILIGSAVARRRP